MADVSRLPSPVSEVWEWQMHGKCRGLDSELFFHPHGERGPRRFAREEAAKDVCRSCPVLRDCAAHALTTREPYGIWGGMGENEREAVLAGAQPLPAILQPSRV